MTDLMEEMFGDQLKEERRAARERVKKARIQGKKEGKREGKQEGQNNLSSLYKKLFNENRNDEIKRISEDYEYRDKLLEEMFPTES